MGIGHQALVLLGDGDGQLHRANVYGKFLQIMMI
jgi:hypothetical protein